MDKSERFMPGKNLNPWEPKDPELDEELKKRQTTQAQAQQQAQTQAQAQANAMRAQQAQMQFQNQMQIQNPASVLRHVGQRRTMGVEEAEAKIDEMLRDIF